MMTRVCTSMPNGTLDVLWRSAASIPANAFGGVVFRATDRRRKQEVALKTLQRAEPAETARFRQEFRALTGVTHKNLVTLYNLTVLDGESFFTMELTRRHQAVHDMVTHTTVQVAESEDLVEFRAERLDEPDVVLPSRFRRLAVIVLYQVVVYFVCSLSLLLLDTTNCFRERSSCSTGMWALLHVFAWAWLALSATVIIAGWKGLLPGARRSRRVSVDVAVA